MPHEVVVTDPVLVRQWWEWSRESMADADAEPAHPFVRWLLCEVIPFSIRLSDGRGGSIEDFDASLFLSVSFRSEADKAAFQARWN
jgi:hypothetical protein